MVSIQRLPSNHFKCLKNYYISFLDYKKTVTTTGCGPFRCQVKLQFRVLRQKDPLETLNLYNRKPLLKGARDTSQRFTILKRGRLKLRTLYWPPYTAASQQKQSYTIVEFQEKTKFYCPFQVVIRTKNVKDHIFRLKIFQANFPLKYLKKYQDHLICNHFSRKVQKSGSAKLRFFFLVNHFSPT